MRKCITLLFPLFLASLCWGDYNTAYTSAFTDLTTYLPTTNLWKQLPSPGACQPNGLSVGTNGDLLCMGTDGYPYQRILGAMTWTKLTAMGNQMHSVIANNGITYALGPGGLDWSICQTQGVNSYSLLVWTGTAWSGRHGCLNMLSITGGGFLVGINVALDTWKSTDGGNTWTQISGHALGPNLNYVSVVSDTFMCGTTATQVFWMQRTGTIVAMPVQPASSGIAGCVVTNDGDSIYAWGTWGVKRFGFKTAVWVAVFGMTSPHGMTTGRKGSTFALSNIGNVPYHLNVEAAFMSGTTSGTFPNGCPPPNGSCTNATHTGTLRVFFPHGLSGITGTSAVSPTTNMNAVSYDFSPTCDPLYGDPSDPECHVQATGSVLCSQSGHNFQPQGPPAPPPVPNPGHWAEWVGSYNGTYTVQWSGQVLSDLAGAEIWCTATNTCRPPTVSVCPPPFINGKVLEGGADIGPGATPASAIAAADKACRRHSVAGAGPPDPGPGAWGFYANYEVLNGVKLCSVITFFDAKPYISICY